MSLLHLLFRPGRTSSLAGDSQAGTSAGSRRVFRGLIVTLLFATASGAAGWRVVSPAVFRRAQALSGDTVIVFGPKQYDGSSGQGQTYVDRFTTTITPGRLYSMRLVNGAPGGTNRASKVVVTLNGYEIVSATEVTQAVAELSRPVAVTDVDTLRVTVAGSGSPYINLSVLTTPDNSFNIQGPTQYAVTSGSSTTYTETVSLPATAATPFRLYVTNGASDGTQRVTSGSVSLSGTEVVATSELTSDVGSLTKVVSLNASNTLAVTVNGSVGRYITVRFTAIDTTHPGLTITSPGPNALTNQTTVTVTGTVSDQTPVGVTVNGVGATVTGNTSYSASVPLPSEGNNVLTVTATDGAGLTTDSTRTVIRDTQAPSLDLVSPADGLVTRNASVDVNGTAADANGVSVNVNGTPFTVDGSGNFGGTIALAAGANVLSATATDGAGNATVVVRNVTQDADPPSLTVTEPADGSTTSADSATVSGTVSDLTAVTVTVNGLNAPLASGSFSRKVALAEGLNTIHVVATDAATNQTTVSRPVTRNLVLPPDPSTVATPIDPTVATTLTGSTAFLYSGPDPIQTGVSAGTIVASRAAVVKGTVVSRDGSPLSGVRVTVVGHPELGQTLSRADGAFDMALNGGGRLTLDYSKAGFLQAQRQLDVPWQDYILADTVALVRLDTAVTTISFSQPIEVAQSTPAADTSGLRRVSLMFSQGTQTTLVLPGGGTQAIDAPIKVRASEYTVGPMGPAAMPASLPATSAYTFAAELTVDTALALGATEARFSQPVASYVENFMGLPVGHAIPVGWYDRQKTTWVPEPDGRVIKIQSVTGGLADLIVDTNGQIATSSQLAALGISDAERGALAGLYPVGQTLWRTQHSHFSIVDYNLIFWLVDQARPPRKLNQRVLTQVKHPHCSGGSIIGCETQTLGEVIPLTGTPYNLHHQSDRVPGYGAESRIELQLSEDTLPAVSGALVGLELEVSVAGRRFRRSFLPVPNFWYTFTWDGLDAYGRPVQGPQPVTIRRGYRYKPYAISSVGGSASSFGSPSTGGGAVAGRPYSEPILWHTWRGTLGAWYTPGQGLGGWTLSEAHAYDGVTRTLYLGTGQRREAVAIGNTIVNAAGIGDSGYTGDGGPAKLARLYAPQRVLPGPDGAFYISNTGRPRISRVNPDGIITTVAGNGSLCPTGTVPACGDGGPATAAKFRFPSGLALGPDGSLYIADPNDARVRRVDPAGIITTFAGTGVGGYNGDGIPATAAQLNQPTDLALGPDGSLYIADRGNNRVRRISTAGVISTVAGNGTGGFFGGDGGLATSTAIASPTAVAVGPDGSLYMSDLGHNRIRRVNPAGIISTVAGNGSTGFAGDGGPATQARIWQPAGLALGSDGSLYIADFNNYRIRRVDNAGIITTVAGDGRMACSPRVNGTCVASDGDGGLATQASLHGALGVAVGPDGTVYLAETNGDEIRSVSPAMPGLPSSDMLVASEEGSEVFRFDVAGRHLKTLDARTGVALLAFGYDASGRLASITDAGGNVTTIERDGNGVPTGVVAPFGQRTALAAGAGGYLSAVTNPAGETVRLYSTSTGILDSLADPRGRVHRFAYDSVGLLRRDDDPAGGFKTLAMSQSDTGYSVTLSTALGRATQYRVTRLPNGSTRRVVIGPNGLADTTTEATNGTTSSVSPDGTSVTAQEGADPRFLMQAPLLRSLTVATPSGLVSSVAAARTVTGLNATDPLSFTSQLDTLKVNGQVFTTVYDASLRRSTTTTPEGRQTITRTDSAGRVLSERIVGLDSVSYQYDNRGRLSQARSGGRTWTYGYDGLGRLLTTLDPLGRRDSLFYDAADRLTRRVLPGGREVRFGYDSSGNLVSVTPAGRPAHAFAYNAVDQDTSYTPPNVGLTTPATRYRYNLDRQLTQIIRPDSVGIGFDYETATGRLSTISFDRGQVALGYSLTTGQLTSLTAPGGATLSFTYDGVLPKTVTWGGPVTGSVAVGYNTDFRVRSQTVNGVDTVTFAYDRDGLLTTAGALGIKRHAQHGLVERDSLDTVKSAWSYTSRGALAGYAATSGAATLFQTAYARDSLDRITSLTETIGGTTTVSAFSYDSAGRLFEVRRDGVLTASYEYDTNGNRTRLTSPAGVMTGTYDDQDRLTGYGTTTYTYGSSGELKTKTEPGIGTTSYTYDALGNLIAVALPDGTAITYMIDPQNRRIGKKVNGTLVQGFLYQSQLAPVAELDGSGQVLSRFVYATRDNVPDYMVKAGQIYRLLLDHLGSVRLVVNASDGRVAQRIDYDEFGRITQNTNPAFQPFAYAGGLHEEQTGLVRFGSRDYDAIVGRWTAKDPLGFNGGDANLYAYINNDPLNATDPLGLWGIGWNGSAGIQGTVVPFLLGGSAQGAVGVGVFGGGEDGVHLGAFASAGAFEGGVLGGIGYPGDRDGTSVGDFTVGDNAGISPVGGFLTNATSAEDLAGPFDTWSAGLGEYSLSLGLGTSADGRRIAILSLNKFRFSPKGSLSRYRTNTFWWKDFVRRPLCRTR